MARRHSGWACSVVILTEGNHWHSLEGYVCSPMECVASVLWWRWRIPAVLDASCSRRSRCSTLPTLARVSVCAIMGPLWLCNTSSLDNLKMNLNESLPLVAPSSHEKWLTEATARPVCSTRTSNKYSERTPPRSKQLFFHVILKSPQCVACLEIDLFGARFYST